MALSGKLTKKQVTKAPPGRHGDGNGLYLVVDPSGARRWVVRVVIKGQKNSKGAPLRTDLGLGGADIVALEEARERALNYRRLAKQGVHPRSQKLNTVPSFEDVAQQVHVDRMPTWKSQKHGQQWINTLSSYAFPIIGKLPVDQIGQPEVLQCLSPIWTEKHETARRLAQRIKIVLDVAKSKGFRDGENPVIAIRDSRVLPPVGTMPVHHSSMPWQELPSFVSELKIKEGMAARSLLFVCLTAARTSEVLGLRWDEIDFENRVWRCPPTRMKGGHEHRVPLTDQMLEIIRPLKTLQSDFVFEGQKRHKPLSNMALLMLLRRMGHDDITVHGFRSTFRVWAAEEAHAPREIAELCLAHRVGSSVERAYARTDQLSNRRRLMEQWSKYIWG